MDAGPLNISQFPLLTFPLRDAEDTVLPQSADLSRPCVLGHGDTRQTKQNKF